MNSSGDRNNNTYLTFKLSGELFVIDVSRVVNIMEISAITETARLTESFRGIVNHKGSIVPVFDLKQKFGLPSKGITSDSGIIVLNINLNNEQFLVGIIADIIREVLDIRADDLSSIALTEAAEYSKYIDFVWKKNNRLIMRLDIDKIFSGSELVFINSHLTQNVI